MSTTAWPKSTGFRTEGSWPPTGTTETRVTLDGGSFTDLAATTEEQSTRMPTAESSWIFSQGEPLPADARMTGSARLELTLSVDRDHAQLAPVLVDVAPDGTTKTVSRGFLNLQYRDGLGTAQPLPPNEPVQATVTFKPQDQIFEAGHRIGATYTVSDSALTLPLAP